MINHGKGVRMNIELRFHEQPQTIHHQFEKAIAQIVKFDGGSKYKDSQKIDALQMPIERADLVRNPIVVATESTGFAKSDFIVCGDKTGIFQSDPPLGERAADAIFHPGDMDMILHATGWHQFFPDLAFEGNEGMSLGRVMEIAHDQMGGDAVLQVRMKYDSIGDCRNENDMNLMIVNGEWGIVPRNSYTVVPGQYQMRQIQEEEKKAFLTIEYLKDTILHKILLLKNLGIIPRYESYHLAYQRVGKDVPDANMRVVQHLRSFGKEIIANQFMAMLRAVPPRWEHDCDGCNYIGREQTVNGSADAYICTSGSLVARLGKDPADYESMDPRNLSSDPSSFYQSYIHMLNRAMTLGLIVPNHYPFLPKPSVESLNK